MERTEEILAAQLSPRQRTEPSPAQEKEIQIQISSGSSFGSCGVSVSSLPLFLSSFLPLSLFFLGLGLFDVFSEASFSLGASLAERCGLEKAEGAEAGSRGPRAECPEPNS